MRNIYRTLTLASFLVAAGSFAIDLGTFLRDGSQPVVAVQSPNTGDEQPARPECDLRVYESARRRLRGAQRTGKQAWEWLGADQHYNYFYFYETGRIECYVRKSAGPLVSPNRGGGQDRPPHTRFAVLACLAVIGLSGAGLVVIRGMRQKQLPPPDS